MAAPVILCDTAGMTNEEWLAARMHGPKGDIPYTVGGSDVAAIFGVSPWTSPLELWLIKKGRIKTPPKNNPDQLGRPIVKTESGIIDLMEVLDITILKLLTK